MEETGANNKKGDILFSQVIKNSLLTGDHELFTNYPRVCHYTTKPLEYQYHHQEYQDHQDYQVYQDYDGQARLMASVTAATLNLIVIVTLNKVRHDT